MVASHDLEALRPEDRKLRLVKSRAKDGDEAAKEAAKEAATKERRSGRPVSRPTLDRALAGGTLNPTAKTRILYEAQDERGRAMGERLVLRTAAQ